MKRTLTRAFALGAGLFIAGFAAMDAAPPASGQTGPGWTQLFDGKTLNGAGTKSTPPTGGSRTARSSPTSRLPTRARPRAAATWSPRTRTRTT